MAGGTPRSTWGTASAIELMWPGVPVMAWATIRPCRSKTPAERSPDSRTMLVKAVRSRAWASCSTTLIRRLHATSTKTGSDARRFMPASA